MGDQPNHVHHQDAMTSNSSSSSSSNQQNNNNTSNLSVISATRDPPSSSSTTSTSDSSSSAAAGVGAISNTTSASAATSSTTPSTIEPPTLCVRSSSATSNITDKSDNDNVDTGSKSSDSGNLGAVVDGSGGKPDKGSDKNSSKSQKNLTERAKKTPWYNAIYPSYKSRTEDFKKLFKEVSDDERLIVDYSCAIQKDILVHGRLYVTQNYLCFHANIIVWETRLSIRWKDVTSITKEKTARVIPNAISVCTDNEKHFLTSFTSRDKTYLMLFRVWQNALMDKPINPQELWQWVHTCYGDQLGLTSDDEDYIDPYDKITEKDSIDDKESLEDLIQQEDLPEDLSDEPTTIIMVAKETTKPKKAALHVKAAFSPESNLSTPSELLPTDMSDSTESEPEEEFFAGVECNSLHSGRQLVHTILPINVDILFELLFSKSRFLTEFHNSRKTTDMIHGEWKVNGEGLKERVVCLTIAITQTIGPRSAQVTETQLMRECSKPGQLYSIDVNAVQGGIPYADSFYVTQHYCMSRTKDDHTVLSVHAQVHYRKNIFGFVRGFIEKNTWVGLEDFYSALLRSLQNEYCIPPAKSKSRRSRKPVPSHHQHHAKDPREEPSSVLRSIPQLPKQPATRASSKPPAPQTFFSWFIVILLVILLSINVALYVKLWNLEGENENLFKSDAAMDPDGGGAFDQKILKNPPQTHADWLALLHEQETKHAKEMIKWQQVLHTVTDLLRKVSSICENIPTNVTTAADQQQQQAFGMDEL